MRERDEQPDHGEHPAGRSGGSGYPEEQPGGANPGVERRDESGDVEAPSQDAGRDGAPGQATGNPDAAGGDVEPSGGDVERSGGRGAGPAGR